MAEGQAVTLLGPRSLAGLGVIDAHDHRERLALDRALLEPAAVAAGEEAAR